ncbi:hypothetical protein EJ110_NYTH26905 [Nymphaea thermarum]|nr:hypothetical protein EJ110_NYTH26905 [Nymphaea thermarum]
MILPAKDGDEPSMEKPQSPGPINATWEERVASRAGETRAWGQALEKGGRLIRPSPVSRPVSAYEGPAAARTAPQLGGNNFSPSILGPRPTDPWPDRASSDDDPERIPTRPMHEGKMPKAAAAQHPGFGYFIKDSTIWKHFDIDVVLWCQGETRPIPERLLPDRTAASSPPSSPDACPTLTSPDLRAPPRVTAKSPSHSTVFLPTKGRLTPISAEAMSPLNLTTLSDDLQEPDALPTNVCTKGGYPPEATNNRRRSAVTTPARPATAGDRAAPSPRQRHSHASSRQRQLMSAELLEESEASSGEPVEEIETSFHCLHSNNAFMKDDLTRVFEDCPTAKEMFDTISSKYNNTTTMHGGSGQGPDPDPSSTREEPDARPLSPSPFPFSSFIVLLVVSRASAEKKKTEVVQAVAGPAAVATVAAWTLTSIVQSMAGNQRSQASPTGDTTAPPKENATTVTFHHFMTMQPPVFTGYGSSDKAEEWIEEIERIFEVLEARNKKMQEFLDLQQNHLSLEEYVTKYRHLEAYCPHLYTTAEARADKFIYGLRDGLRGRVMSGSPHNLDEAVTMARHMEEDWVRTQRDHQKKTSQHTQGGRMPVKHHHPAGRARPYERRDDRTFRRNRPGRGETTQGSVASPTSPRCPTCSCPHPGKSCYRMTGACLHCGEKKKTEVVQAVAGPAAATTAAAVATAAAWVHRAHLDDLELKDSKLEAF